MELNFVIIFAILNKSLYTRTSKSILLFNGAPAVKEFLLPSIPCEIYDG